MPQNIKVLISSMLKAVITGIVLATLFLFIHNSLPEYIYKIKSIIVKNPSFLPRSSQILVYSYDDGREVIRNAKDSISNTGEIKISASAYVVMDMDRKTIVLEKNADKLLPLASVTKLITAIIAKKLFDENDYLEISKSAIDTYGNEAKFREGESFGVKELLYPLLMVSSNDAAEVLARQYGRAKFIKEMNNWVSSIGAYRTYFKDPSGLSPQNVSTARDLSIVTKWILENDPEIFEITLLKSKTIRTHTWINPTHFLNLESYAGGKNGYTPEAHRTGISLFKLGKQKRLFAVTLLGSDARDDDILDLLDEAVR
ncbi:MAG: serine hydrolase [Patescibacteria group bacterium]